MNKSIDTGTNPERHGNKGAEAARSVEQRRITAERAVLRNAFGADLRNTSFSLANGLPANDADMRGVVTAFKEDAHVPSALRESPGWKRWAGENKAHNFLAITAAARQAGMDRFSATAITGLVFQRIHDMGAGGGRLDAVDIRVHPEMGEVEVILTYDQYGDVRMDKRAKPTRMQERLSVTPQDVTRYRVAGLGGTVIDRQRAAASLSDEKIGFATFDKKTGTLFATRRVETSNSTGWEPVAVLEPHELLTDAEQEIIEAAPAKHTNEVLKELLAAKGNGRETEAWVDVGQIDRRGRAIAQLAAMAEAITGPGHEAAVAEGIARARKERTEAVRKMLAAETAGALRQALKEKMDAERRADSGIIGGLFAAIRRLSEPRREPMKPQAVDAALRAAAKEIVDRTPVALRGEVTSVRLLQPMASADKKYLVANANIEARVEPFVVNVPDPRPGRSTEMLTVEIRSSYTFEADKNRVSIEVPLNRQA